MHIFSSQKLNGPCRMEFDLPATVTVTVISTNANISNV